MKRPCINSDFVHWCQNCRAPLGAPTSAGRLRLLGGGVVEGRGPGQGPGVTRSLRAMTADTARGAPVAEYTVMMDSLSISEVFGKLITGVVFHSANINSICLRHAQTYCGQGTPLSFTGTENRQPGNCCVEEIECMEWRVESWRGEIINSVPHTNNKQHTGSSHQPAESGR